MHTNRRDAIKMIALGSSALIAQPWRVFGESVPVTAALNARYPFQLADLPYAYDAVEDAVDAETMRLHHSRHHAAYVNNLNRALEQHAEWQGATLRELLEQLDALPEAIRESVRNNGGGHANHELFWALLALTPGALPSGELAERINTTFGSWETLRDQLRGAALSVFGSGWAWLSLSEGELRVETTPNQDTPIMYGRQPLLGIDVWEHAYYLRYQNRRADYVDAVLNQINWDVVSAGLDA